MSIWYFICDALLLEPVQILNGVLRSGQDNDIRIFTTYF